jgi:DNA-binding HxlR family transcriptional regulator
MPRSAAHPEPRSRCPLANVLDVVGDRWTLLVLRDLLFAGKARFAQLQHSPEAIPTNLLADRLRRLEEAGLITKSPYQQAPIRYEYKPTARGADFLPALRELAGWAARHLPGVGKPPPGFFDGLLARWQAELGPADGAAEAPAACGR